MAALTALALSVGAMPTQAWADSANTGSISGTIRDSHGAVPYAQANAWATNGQQYPVLADADGNYTITDVPYGDYTVSAFEPSAHLMNWVGGEANPTVLTVTSTPVLHADVTLTRLGWVHGRVTLPNGSAAANAPVTLWATDSGARYTTDGNGEFVIPSGPGTFTLYAEIADAYPKTFYTSSGSTTEVTLATSFALAEDDNLTHNITLQPGTHITGHVTTDGVATSEVTVLAQELINDKWVSAGQGITDAQGNYSLMVGAGHYWLTFSHLSTGHYRYQEINVGAAAASQTINQELLPGFDTTPIPTISGQATVGSTLTATVGTWSPTPDTVSYQWLRNGLNIAGATTARYQVTSTDVGTQLAVVVTAAKADYLRASMRSGPTATVPPVPTPPLKTIKGTTPKITGTTKVGKTLKITRGAWSPTGLSFSYQWYRSGKTIKGATKSSYKLTKSDKGKYLTVKVTAKRTGYKTLSLTSKKTAKVR